MTFGNILATTNLQVAETAKPSENTEFIKKIFRSSKLKSFNNIYARIDQNDYGFKNILLHHFDMLELDEKKMFFENINLISMIDLLDYHFKLVKEVINFLYDMEAKQLDSISSSMFYSSYSLVNKIQTFYNACCKEEIPNSKNNLLFNHSESIQHQYISDVILLEEVLTSLKNGTALTFDSFDMDECQKRIYTACFNICVNKKFIDVTGKVYDLQYVLDSVVPSIPFAFIEKQQVKSEMNDAEKEKLVESLVACTKHYATVKMIGKKIYVKLNEPFVPESCSLDNHKEGLRAYIPDEIKEVLLKSKYVIAGFVIPLESISESRSLPSAVYAMRKIDFDNHEYIETIHPHASSGSGNICFGTMNKSGDSNRQFNIGDLIQMLKNINFSSVYRSISLPSAVQIKGKKVEILNSERSTINLMGELGGWEERAIVGIDAFFKI